MFAIYSSNPRNNFEKPERHDLKTSQPCLKDRLLPYKRPMSLFGSSAKILVSGIVLYVVLRLWESTLFTSSNTMDLTKEKPLDRLFGKPITELSDSKVSDSSYIHSAASCARLSVPRSYYTDVFV